MRLYYPVRIVDGRERIPAGRPLIFVLNHPNGLLDPLVLRVSTGRPSRFLAKSSLFGNPATRLAMTAFGSIPIYRAHESGGEHAARNEESFARCRAELAGGGVLALFPEGVSHSDPQLRALKTGAARIALSAEAEHGGRLDVAIVPVGLAYERKTMFRSSVVLVVGESIPVAPLLAAYQADERAAVNALTDRIGAGLDEIVLQAESRELVAGIVRVARWTGETPADPAAQHRRARELAGGYARLRERDPARLEAIVGDVTSYVRTLRRLGVRDPWALELPAPPVGAVAQALLAVVLAAPVAAIGAVMGWLPYRLAGWVAARVTRDEDLLSTVKLLAGALFLLVGWAAESVAVGWWRGAAWALPTFALGLGSGYVALRFEELLRDGRSIGRAVSLRALRFDLVRRLADRRRALADRIARALDE